MLLLLVILGIVVSRKSPHNAPKKTTTTTPTRPSVRPGSKRKLPPKVVDIPAPQNKVTSTPHADNANKEPRTDHLSAGDKDTSATTDAWQLVGLDAVYVNNIYNAAFLGCCGYLAMSLYSSGKLPNPTLLGTSILYYFAAALGGYILCFFYQNYATQDSLPTGSLLIDSMLFGLASILTGLGFVVFSIWLMTTSIEELKSKESDLRQKIEGLIQNKKELSEEIKQHTQRQLGMQQQISTFTENQKLIQQATKQESLRSHTEPPKMQVNIQEESKENQKLIQPPQQATNTAPINKRINKLQDLHKKTQENIQALQTHKKKITQKIKRLWKQVPSIKPLRQQLLAKTLFSCGIMLVAYWVVINVIEEFKSNHKLNPIKFYSMQLLLLLRLANKVFSLFIVTSIWRTMVYKTTYNHLYRGFLWSIAACFLYVQAFWEPKLGTSGQQKIGGKIAAWLFHSSHVWEGLAAIPLTYFFSLGTHDPITSSIYKTMCWWALWECCKWALLYFLLFQDPKRFCYSELNHKLSLRKGFYHFIGGMVPCISIAPGSSIGKAETIHSTFSSPWASLLQKRHYCVILNRFVFYGPLISCRDA